MLAAHICCAESLKAALIQDRASSTIQVQIQVQGGSLYKHKYQYNHRYSYGGERPVEGQSPHGYLGTFTLLLTNHGIESTWPQMAYSGRYAIDRSRGQNDKGAW